MSPVVRATVFTAALSTSAVWATEGFWVSAWCQRAGRVDACVATAAPVQWELHLSPVMGDHPDITNTSAERTREVKIPVKQCLQVKGSETTLSFSLALWSGTGNVRQMPSKAETQGQETFPYLSHRGVAQQSATVGGTWLPCCLGPPPGPSDPPALALFSLPGLSTSCSPFLTFF